MYTYPSAWTDEMIGAIADCERVCKYVDIPLQHINDRVLGAMHRGIDRAATEELLQKIRDRIPGVAVRTTMMAGFPGETDKEFAELIQFVKDFRFDALGVFPYSCEPQTPAARMKGQLPDTVKQERVDALMTVQQDVAFALAKERIGSRIEVLVDERLDDNQIVGRHEGQAPDVDGVTYVRECQASAGEFVTVDCVGSDTYDLLAIPAGVAPSVH